MNTRIPLLSLGLAWCILFVLGLQIEPPYFRPFEQMRAGDLLFHPNRQVEMDAFGGLSYRYFAPEIRHYKRNVFTTDNHGFRNPSMGQPPVVVVGDSFTYGVGLSDSETFPQALSRQLKVPVYNYGTQGAKAPRYFLSDRRFGRPGEVVLFMPSENGLRNLRMPPKTGEPAPTPRKIIEMPTFLSPLKTYGSDLEYWNEVINRDNGINVWARLSYQNIRRTLLGHPNRIMADGAPALVETLAEQKRTTAVSDPKLKRIVDSYVRWHQILKQRNSKLMIAIIPQTGSVYEDAFPEKERKKISRPSIKDRVQKALIEQGILVIDLMPLYTQNRTPYLYLRDDTHWNPRTVELTAEHIAKALRSQNWLALPE